MDKIPIVLRSGAETDCDVFLLGGEPEGGGRSEDEFPSFPPPIEASYFGPPFDSALGRAVRYGADQLGPRGPALSLAARVWQRVQLLGVCRGSERGGRAAAGEGAPRCDGGEARADGRARATTGARRWPDAGGAAGADVHGHVVVRGGGRTGRCRDGLRGRARV